MHKRAHTYIYVHTYTHAYIHKSACILIHACSIYLYTYTHTRTHEQTVIRQDSSAQLQRLFEKRWRTIVKVKHLHLLWVRRRTKPDMDEQARRRCLALAATGRWVARACLLLSCCAVGWALTQHEASIQASFVRLWMHKRGRGVLWRNRGGRNKNGWCEMHVNISFSWACCNMHIGKLLDRVFGHEWCSWVEIEFAISQHGHGDSTETAE